MALYEARVTITAKDGLLGAMLREPLGLLQEWIAHEEQIAAGCLPRRSEVGNRTIEDLGGLSIVGLAVRGFSYRTMHDGTESQERATDVLFKALDVNQDGVIDINEFRAGTNLMRADLWA